MPLLSVIFSLVLVGSASIYSYLKYSEKIDKAKMKVSEVKRVEATTKEIFFKKSSTKRIDGNISIIDMKLSKLAVQDGNLKERDFLLLDKLQESAKNLPLSIKSPTCKDFAKTQKITLNECEEISNKKIDFYKIFGSASDMIYSNNSIVKNVDLRKDVSLWSARKNRRYLKKDFVDSDKKVDILQREKDPKVVELLVETIDDTAKASVSKKKFLKVASKVIENFSVDEKEKIQRLINEKSIKLKKEKEKRKKELQQKEKELLLAKIKNMYDYYKRRIQSVSSYKSYRVLLNELVLLRADYSKKISYINRKSEICKIQQKSSDSFFGFFKKIFVQKSSCDEKKLKKEKENLLKEYETKKRELLYKQRLYTENMRNKSKNMDKLAKCYNSQLKSKNPSLKTFKSCVNTII
jgi:hypothetical protein